MSMPFPGPPILKNIANLSKINQKLALLKPKRKHYQYYFSSYRANNNIMKCEQGLSNLDNECLTGKSMIDLLADVADDTSATKTTIADHKAAKAAFLSNLGF